VLAACAGLNAALHETDGDGGDHGDLADPARLAALAGREFPGDVVENRTTPLGADTDEPVTHFAFGWATQVVTLDDDGRIERVIAAQDVGRVLNPTLLRGQVVGGVPGLGTACGAFRWWTASINDSLKSLDVSRRPCAGSR
jgi:CO/xanthine dehydrogenase Mo-binding subunit